MTMLKLKTMLTNKQFQHVLNQVFTGQKTAEQIKREYNQ